MGIFSLTLSRRATEVGEGGFFYLEESKNNCFKETLGEGTNNWAKLNSMWSSIRLATKKVVTHVQILGDFNTSID